ncbi:sulfatase [candidate division KSB1 bacterium]|nr:sulfatase [candidate division KSB1 bacterium]
MTLTLPQIFCQSNTVKKKPNFVFILIDDMGWTDLSGCGSDLYESPNIDKLFASGMKFTNAYSACTVCSPTRASILTGKYPASVNITDWIPGHARPWAKLKVPEFNQELPLSEITIAEALKPAGYAAASLGKWHLGQQNYYPEKQGFDINIGGTDRGQPPSYFSPYRIPTLNDGPEGEYLTDRLADEAGRFIEKNKDNPFFLYWAHFAVHTPIQAKQEITAIYKAKIKSDMLHTNPVYAAMIQSVDEAVGRVMKKLKDLGIAGHTVIIFMSDNGGLARVTSNVPLRAGKGSAYEGGVRTPMAICWPGVVKPQSYCHIPVCSIDFYPTILEMAGVTILSTVEIDGESLVPLLKQEGELERDTLYWHYPHYHPGGTTPYSAVRKGDYKLIEFFEDGALELYNLIEDIGETNNLAPQMTEKVNELHDMLKEWRNRTGARIPAPNPDYDKKREGEWARAGSSK